MCLIAGDDPDIFVSAVTTFHERCRRFGARLNDQDTLPQTPEAILDAADTTKVDITFLGEVFRQNAVCNNKRNLEKLHTAFTRLQGALRNVASLISLALWMAHTINITPRDHFEVLRHYRKLAQLANASRWDTTPHTIIIITPELLRPLGQLIGPILNVPAVPPTLCPARESQQTTAHTTPSYAWP
eukprot:PhM_4_TR2051/c1_g1_i1/m.9373